MNPITGKRILLGITGSIAVYKAADLASKLAQQGAELEVIFTPAAEKFVSPLTFQSVTGRPTHTDADLWGSQAHVLHVSLSKPADLFLIAPATANTIAKMAHGLADNLLTVTALASTCPLILAPAMDGGMYSSPANQANLAVLAERGAVCIGPEEGHLASGLTARGRMTEPGEIVAQVRFLLSRTGPLAGRRIIVTAGGTQEPIDPVRVIGNRSSGKQGLAIAQAALDAGADVTVIAPSHLPVPVGASSIHAVTAEEMRAAVMESVAGADALVMAAAVADFRIRKPENNKIKKRTAPLTLELEPTTDILRQVAEQREATGFPRMTVGFAAETEDLEANARGKLNAKKLDLIVANPVGEPGVGMEADANRVTVFDKAGDPQAFPVLSKQEVAEMLVLRIQEFFDISTK